MQNRREYHPHLTAVYQHYLGLTTQFFTVHPDTICYKPLNSKMTFLWTEMWKYDVQLISKSLWIPESPFDNDMGIMETVLLQRQRERAGTSSAISARMIRNTNTVRIYMRCTFLSDIVEQTAGGPRIPDYIMHASRPRQMTEVHQNSQHPALQQSRTGNSLSEPHLSPEAEQSPQY